VIGPGNVTVITVPTGVVLHLTLLPDPVQTISRAVYEPGDVYVWVAFLLDRVVVLYHELSPKFHIHCVGWTQLVRFVNLTTSGVYPVLIFTVKFTIGSLDPVTVIISVTFIHPVPAAFDVEWLTV
jgi:hypothetical protein